MSDIIVFPEQISFDVRIQKSNPRRRLTVKNLGVTSAKVSINPPTSDSCIITDSKGREIRSRISFTLTPDSSQFIFIQKKSAIGIIPEDFILIEGGKAPIRVALKPAVSLVTLDELENVGIQKPMPDSARSVNSQQNPTESQGTNKKSEIAKDDDIKVIYSNPKSDRSAKISDRMKQNQYQIPAKPAKFTSKSEEDLQKIDEMPEKVLSLDEVKETTKSSLPPPSSTKPLQVTRIPEPTIRKTHKNELPYSPEVDVLKQSLSVKFSLKDDAFSPLEKQNNSAIVKWYEDGAFEKVAEPDFSFELMMVGKGEEPIFCIDGDYYDPSGRLLTVQQGKMAKVFVTEDAKEPFDKGDLTQNVE